jgi:hypothetical protein
MDEELRKRKEIGVLFVDDCHNHMREVNKIIDETCENKTHGLKILLVSTRHHWNPRSKSPAIFSLGTCYELNQLRDSEINGLLDLLEKEPEIRALVEDRFLGFSRAERVRRLSDRCGADMFVCMKNIFGFESIDNIILKDFADLHAFNQEIYRTVAAMEAAGVRVHRQLIIRSLGIEANTIASLIDNMKDMITEYTIDTREGLYGWRTRHSVVAEILTKYKYADHQETYELFEKIISNLNPTYQIELRTIRDICDMRAGIGKITDRRKRNYLLRRMISLAPGERVPRHRLIWNLIDGNELEEAEREIRLFEKEIWSDAPVHRYKILLTLKRAEETEGILEHDRSAIILQAATTAQDGVRKFQYDKNIFTAYCRVGLAYAKISGNWEIYDDSMEKLREAEERIMDPEIRKNVRLYERLGQRLLRGA